MPDGNYVEITVSAKDDTGPGFAAADARAAAFSRLVDQTTRREIASSQAAARAEDARARAWRTVGDAAIFVRDEEAKAAQIEQDLGDRAQQSGQRHFFLRDALAAVGRALGGGGAGSGGLSGDLAAAEGDMGGAASSASGLGAAFSGMSLVITGPLIAALGVLLTAYIGPLIAGLALVTVGIGTFAAAAFPVFSQLKSSLTALSTATDSYQQASLNLDQAIRKSPADMQAYHAVLQGLEPDLRSAAMLLTDQNVKWQNLSPSMQKSVVALANNSAALKTLLPDQKNALNALMQQKAAWDAMSPAQQKIAGQMDQLGAAFGKIQKAVQPAVYTALATAIKILNQLMPTLKIMAVAAGNALDGLLKHISSWLASPAGQKFIHWMQVEGPRAIATFGHFLWDLITVIGNVAHFMAQAGDFMRARFSQNMHGISIQLDDIRIAFIHFGHDVEAVWNSIVNAISRAVDWIIGKIHALGSALTSIPGGGFLGTAMGFLGFASGGITGAASGGLRSGLQLVGERGAELVQLPAGSRVYNHGQTQQMLGASGGGAQQLVLEPMAGGSGLDQMFFTWLANGIRTRGGDPRILTQKVSALA